MPQASGCTQMLRHVTALGPVAAECCGHSLWGRARGRTPSNRGRTGEPKIKKFPCEEISVDVPHRLFGCLDGCFARRGRIVSYFVP